MERAAETAAQSGGMVADTSVRRSIQRDPPPRDPAQTPTMDQLRLRLAEELDYARRMLDAMGNQLASDAVVVVRHCAALQTVDIVGRDARPRRGRDAFQSAGAGCGAHRHGRDEGPVEAAKSRLALACLPGLP